MKALIAEDSRLLALMHAELLTALGFEVTTVPDGVEALERLSLDTLPDLVLLDWSMPRLDGLDVINHMRLKERLNKIPAIMVSAEDDLGMREWASEAGANAYLVKPLKPEALAATLDRLGLLPEAQAPEKPQEPVFGQFWLPEDQFVPVAF